MLDASARLLRLLSMLQVRPDWTGAELARRLDVTTRTLRRDVQRLRSLGYPVHATPGVAGGYRLGAGAALPPLLLDDDEAVAVVVSLRTIAIHLAWLGADFTVLEPPELIEHVRALAVRLHRAADSRPGAAASRPGAAASRPEVRPPASPRCGLEVRP